MTEIEQLNAKIEALKAHNERVERERAEAARAFALQQLDQALYDAGIHNETARKIARAYVLGGNQLVDNGDDGKPAFRYVSQQYRYEEVVSLASGVVRWLESEPDGPVRAFQASQSERAAERDKPAPGPSVKPHEIDLWGAVRTPLTPASDAPVKPADLKIRMF